MWAPQIRYEQSYRLSDTTSVRAQVGIVETQENLAYEGSTSTVDIAPAHSALRPLAEPTTCKEAFELLGVGIRFMSRRWLPVAACSYLGGKTYGLDECR